MKRLKRQISMLTLLFFMCCFVLPIIPPTPAEAADSARTSLPASYEAGWKYYTQPINKGIRANNGGNCTWYAYGRICEINDQEMPHFSGNANTWFSQATNKGYEIGYEPAIGAIMCWGGTYGHVAVVESIAGDYVILSESNYDDSCKLDPFRVLKWNKNGNRTDANGNTMPFQGYIYVSGKTRDAITIQNNTASNITETNVYLSAKVLNNYQRVTEVGCYLSTDGVNWPYKASDAVNITDAYTNVWYDNTARDFGIALQPGTTYYYKFYAVVNGNYNEGQVGSFSTTGSKNTTPTQPSVPPTSNIDGVTEGIRLTLDGKNIITPVAPIIEHGTTLVPLRVISESLGAQVSWQQDSKTITIQKDDIKIRLQIGNTMVEVNDAFGKTLAVAPQIKDGTTMVPLRFISETLGCEVTWDAANQVIGISTNKQPVKQPELEKKPAMQINQGEKISASSWHTMVVKNDGTLWSWGDNLHGRLGTGSDRPGSSNTPLQIAAGVKSVSASGFRHCMLVKTDGSLWGWGDNGHGELGIGTTANQLQPVKVMNDVAMVSAGSYHTAAVKTDGSLWVWGYNQYGSVGNGTTENVLSPVKIMDNIIMVSAGDKSTFAVDKNGNLYAWGMDNAGKLGNGHRGTQKGVDGNIIQTAPIKIMSDVVYVSAGVNHTAAIKKDGSLWTWGNNNDGQLGNGVEDKSSYVPVKVLDNVASVQCSDNNTLAVKKDGSLWMWGKNDYGQLMSSNKVNVLSPVKVLDGVKEADLGYGHVAVIKTDGNIYTWGWNGHGQLGDGKEKSTVTLTKVMGL